MTRTILSTLAVAAVLLMSSAPPAVSQRDVAHTQEMEYLKQDKGSRRRGWGSGNYNAQYASPNAAGKKGPKLQTDTTKPKRKRQAR